MLELHRVALRSASLCKQLVVDEMLIQFLLEDKILTESMAEVIMVGLLFSAHWFAVASQTRTFWWK